MFLILPKRPVFIKESKTTLRMKVVLNHHINIYLLMLLFEDENPTLYISYI